MSEINYILVEEENSNHGGYCTKVRAFAGLKNARDAMVASYIKMAGILQILQNSNPFRNKYTVVTKNGIRIYCGEGVFHWKITRAVPEDGELSDLPCDCADAPGPERWRGMTKYTITVKGHVSQSFSVEAYSIFHAIDAGERRYEKSVGQHSPSAVRLIMAQDDETGEKTGWKEF